MITLRTYQTQLVDQLRQKLRSEQRVIAVSPTGSGKRMVACWMAAEICKRKQRVGVVTDRRILVNQMGDECRAHEIPYGLRMGDSPRNEFAPVQICTIQTLKSRKWEDLPKADVWLIDEAHKTTHAYMQLLEHYPDAKVISFTATPVGRNGRSLTELGPRVEPYRNTELIRQGWLLPTRCYAPSEPNLKGVTLSGGEYNQKQLGKRIQDCTVIADIFKWWKPYSDRQTICFTPRVKFAEGLAEQFEEYGVTAACVTGETPKYERDQIFRDFSAGKINVLVSVSVLIEGFDAPIASCGIDLTPNKQFRAFWQKVGRIRRPYGSQEYGVWLDFSGNLWRFTHPDDDPEWPEGDENIQDLVKEKKQKEKEEKDPWSCSNCGYVLATWERLKNNTCPQCGTKTSRAVRRVRMGDGKVRRVPLKEQRKVKKTHEQTEWNRARYQCHYMGKPLFVAAKMYQNRVGYPPAQHLTPPPPPAGSSQWRWQAADVYPEMRKR